MSMWKYYTYWLVLLIKTPILRSICLFFFADTRNFFYTHKTVTIKSEAKICRLSYFYYNSTNLSVVQLYTIS